MAIFRVKKTGNYTVMSNHHFKNRNLSLRAKGLLSLMLSLPDDWDYSVEGLVTLSKDGRDAVRSTLKELEEAGYLVITQEQAENGQYRKVNYDIYEKPMLQKMSDSPTCPNAESLEKSEFSKKEMSDSPYAVCPTSVEPTSGKPTQLNTKESNTKKSNTNTYRTPTIEEIRAYIQEKNYNVDANFFYEYYEEGGWRDSEGKPVKSWKQKLLTWHKKNNEKRKQERNPKSSFETDGIFPL